MWDERYSTEDYAYGTEPNKFLASRFNALPKGRILSLAEGEGRNAVFLAKHGYLVTAVDSSKVGLEKAARLAVLNQVSIECIYADLAAFEFVENYWDGIISIFCPLPSELGAYIHAQVEASLKTGGVFLSESYTPKQIEYGTGGGAIQIRCKLRIRCCASFPSLSSATCLKRNGQSLKVKDTRV